MWRASLRAGMLDLPEASEGTSWPPREGVKGRSWHRDKGWRTRTPPTGAGVLTGWTEQGPRHLGGHPSWLLLLPGLLQALPPTGQAQAPG